MDPNIESLCMVHARNLDRELATLRTALEAARQATADLHVQEVLNVDTRFVLPHRHQETMYEHIKAFALEKLSPTGTPLAVDALEVHDRFFGSQWGEVAPTETLKPFTAEAAMRELLDAVAPIAENVGLGQLATRIFHRFGREPTREVKGATVFTMSAWTEEARYSGDHTQYCYSTQRDVEDTLGMFTEVLPRVGVSVTKPAASFMRNACRHDFVAAGWKASREFRGRFGKIEVRAFQRKIEFHVPHDWAAAINLFVGTYLPERVRAA